ncbi:hypothetical protein Mycsm_00775 [Mycobacterium sp. JS623]|nr:hypothetical protein Mycsm_00775 [Mycobacterium sp. JS623]
MQNGITHWLNNDAFAGSGGSLPVTNPATGAVTGQVALATVEDMHTVIDAAAEASPRGKAITSRWLDPSHGGIELSFRQNK